MLIPHINLCGKKLVEMLTGMKVDLIQTRDLVNITLNGVEKLETTVSGLSGLMDREIKMKKVCPDVDMCGISENIVEMKEELLEESLRSKQEEQSGIIEKKLSLLFENR